MASKRSRTTSEKRQGPNSGTDSPQAEIEIGIFAWQCLVKKKKSDTCNPAARSGSLECQSEPRPRNTQPAVHWSGYKRSKTNRFMRSETWLAAEKVSDGAKAQAKTGTPHPALLRRPRAGG